MSSMQKQTNAPKGQKNHVAGQKPKATMKPEQEKAGASTAPKNEKDASKAVDHSGTGQM